MVFLKCLSWTRHLFGPLVTFCSTNCERTVSHACTLAFSASSVQLMVCLRLFQFVKPTDKHQYLHSTSCHPQHCKTSISYSQARWLWRICPNDSFLRHSQVLNKHLMSRGHSLRTVHQNIKKVKSMPRLSVLSEKPTIRDCSNKKIPLVVTYHPSLPPYIRLPVLTTISSTPQIASNNMQSPRSLWLLSDALLVQAEVPPTNDSSIPPIQHGMFRCTSRCITCQEHILESDSFKSHSTVRSGVTLPVLLLT